MAERPAHPTVACFPDPTPTRRRRRLTRLVGKGPLRKPKLTETFAESAEPLCWPDPDVSVHVAGDIAPKAVTVPTEYLASLPDDTPVKIEVGAIGADDNATLSDPPRGTPSRVRRIRQQVVARV